MTEKPEKDREPWFPKIEGLPLFTNSADYERTLGEDSPAPVLETADAQPEGNKGEATDGAPDGG